FFSFNSSIGNSVGLGATSMISGSMSIGGNLYLDNDPPSYTATGTIGGSKIYGDLTKASADAMSAANTAKNLTANNSLISNGTGSYHLNLNSGLNVVNFSTKFTATNATIVIKKGTGNEQVVFNFQKGLSFTNVNIVLTGGLTWDNVFFNIVGGNVGWGGSDISGTILNMSGGSMSLDNNYIHGSVISDGFIDLSGSIIAPELPTITMAGLACALVLGKVGLVRLRRRRQLAAV